MKKINIIILLSMTISLFSMLLSCSSEKQNTITEKISVRVFNGNGASKVCVTETIEALKLDAEIDAQQITAAQIMDEALSETDVLIFPGGSGSKEFNNLGFLGAQKVRKFGQQEGKGVVGICAGGYLLGSTPNYPNLHMIPLIHIREHYNRGRGLISFSQTASGDMVFPENRAFDSLYVQYYDGPIYQISDTSSVEVLATINTDIATKNKDPHGVTAGKPAFLSYNYGQGKIIVSIGHPEATHGMRWMVPRMARMSINAPLIAYSKEVVKPGSYKRELLFFAELNRYEKEQFWLLSSDDPHKIMMAIDELKRLHSRPSIRWSIGLLRHSEAMVRLKAAEYLVFTEYTDALIDLKQAVKNEHDADIRQSLEKYYTQLNSYTMH